MTNGGEAEGMERCKRRVVPKLDGLVAQITVRFAKLRSQAQVFGGVTRGGRLRCNLDPGLLSFAPIGAFSWAAHNISISLFYI